MGGASGTYVERRGACRGFVRKTEGEKTWKTYVR
jgi:hypothetical protein